MIWTIYCIMGLLLSCYYVYSKIPIIRFATYQGTPNWSYNLGPSLQKNETMHAPENVILINLA